MKRHCRKNRFEKLPPNTKLVARPSRWGNPFTIKDHGREECLRLFRQHLADNPELVEQARKELTGFNLACYCKLDQACHTDVWLEVLNQ